MSDNFTQGIWTLGNFYQDGFGPEGEDTSIQLSMGAFLQDDFKQENYEHENWRELSRLDDAIDTDTYPDESDTNDIVVGSLVCVVAAFAKSGTAVDPTAVKFSVRSPSGTVATYTYVEGGDIGKISVGKYYLNVSMSASGIWYVRAWSTGTGQAAEEVKIVARAAMAVA